MVPRIGLVSLCGLMLGVAAHAQDPSLIAELAPEYSAPLYSSNNVGNATGIVLPQVSSRMSKNYNCVDFAGSDIQGLVDVSVGDVWTAVVNGLTIVFADRQADIFPVLSQGERVLLVGVSDAGLLPEPGRVCGELLVVGDSDAQDAVFINEFPGRRGVESVTVVVAATDSVDAVLFGLYTNVYNQGLGIPMSIAVLDRGPVRERSAAREFASPTLNSDVSSVLMRDGQAFGLFEGDNRLVSDEVVVELHGDVVRTVALSPTSGIDVSLRDNRFWLERTDRKSVV